MSGDGPILYVDATAGAAGDMLLAALVDLGVPLGSIRDAVRRLPIEGWRLSTRMRDVHGIRARRVHVRVSREEAGGAAHRRWRDVRRIVRAGRLPRPVETRALAVFRRLFEAEAEVHGATFESVHLHEAGAVDALIDVVGTCVALHRIAPSRIVVSPLTTGHGRVRCRHGLYPVPAPATQRLILGVPATSGDAPGERLTPTGAAILTTIADAWGPMPMMVAERVGSGAGERDFDDRPNLVRAVLGRATVDPSEDSGPRVTVLECQIDDATPQTLAWTVERVLAEGALDALVRPVTMKKGRPGHLLTVLARPDDRDRVARVVLRETPTFGLRWRDERRIELERTHREVATRYGTIRVKVGTLDGEEVQASPEYEDCALAARRTGATLREVRQAALLAYRRRRRAPRTTGG